MTIELIVAMSENNVIGVNNQLPWHLPDDLKHFKKITTGKAILMGRKTYESIGKPLPKRTNIILTSDPAFMAPGCSVVNSIEEALEMANALDGMVVIGGGHVYEQFLPMAEKIHLTLVHTVLDGDAHFPTLDQDEWDEHSIESHDPDEKHLFGFTFKEYKKKGAMRQPKAG